MRKMTSGERMYLAVKTTAQWAFLLLCLAMTVDQLGLHHGLWRESVVFKPMVNAVTSIYESFTDSSPGRSSHARGHFLLDKAFMIGNLCSFTV